MIASIVVLCIELLGEAALSTKINYLKKKLISPIFMKLRHLLHYKCIIWPIGRMFDLCHYIRSVKLANLIYGHGIQPIDHCAPPSGRRLVHSRIHVHGIALFIHGYLKVACGKEARRTSQ